MATDMQMVEGAAIGLGKTLGGLMSAQALTQTLAITPAEVVGKLAVSAATRGVGGPAGDRLSSLRTYTADQASAAIEPRATTPAPAPTATVIAAAQPSTPALPPSRGPKPGGMAPV